MSLEEAEYECFILTVGSQDTSAAFISALFGHLLENPDVCRKVLDEISLGDRDGKLSSPVVTYDETVELQYFMACVHETLRLSPSVSMMLPRCAPAGGMWLKETWIPGRAEVAANPYVVHRDVNIFGSDAATFRPERWLGDSEPVRLMHKFSFAFGYGSRKCLGKYIALFTSQKFCVQVLRPQNSLTFFEEANVTSNKLLRDFVIRSSSLERPCRIQNWGINIYFEQYVELKARTNSLENKNEQV